MQPEELSLSSPPFMFVKLCSFALNLCLNYLHSLMYIHSVHIIFLLVVLCNCILYLVFILAQIAFDVYSVEAQSCIVHKPENLSAKICVVVLF
jgi:hypothetical protein